MQINLPSWAYPIILLLVLIIAGAAEYLHLAPAGSFYTVFLLVIGLIAPSPAFPHGQVVTSDSRAIKENTVATQENTQATEKELNHG